MITVAAEGLGADVDPFVVAGGGNQQVVDAEANGLLGFGVTFNQNVAAIPLFLPGFGGGL